MSLNAKMKESISEDKIVASISSYNIAPTNPYPTERSAGIFSLIYSWNC